MKCPKCDFDVGHNIYCLNCGVNIEIYNKCKAISAKLYNNALAMANNRDLSSAIETLNKSIEFDKTNYNSRNLLGLIYFEVGEIGSALKEWIISSSYFKDDNLAKGYIDTIQNNSRKLERYNDAVKMYNKSLNYMEQKSEDIAIIQLKKALEINPKFLKAYNLLTLCYIHEKNNDKALACIEKALEIDFANKNALRYYNELKKGSIRPLKIDKNRKTQSDAKAYSPVDKKLRKRTAMSNIGSFVIGAVTIAVVMSVLVFPAIKNAKDSEIAQLTESKEAFEKDLNDKSNQNKQLSEQLKSETEKLQQENTELKKELEEQQKVQKVQQVRSLYDANQKEEAAVLLLSLEGTEFQTETKTLYESLKVKILPEVARKYYNEGMANYSAKKYSEAKILLENSINTSTIETYSSDALYFIGRIDEINGDIVSAKTSYQKLIDTYPNAKQLSNAKYRLGQLG